MDLDNKKTLSQDAINSVFDPLMDGLAEAAGKEGWTYRDVRWLTEENWQKFLAIVGEGNYQCLIATQRSFKDEPGVPYFGGQFLISPEGMDNMRSYVG